MLRGTEKWVTYFVLAIVFIFGIVFLAKQIDVTTDLKQSLAQAKASGVLQGDLKNITHLHNASAKVFFLSFFALCLLLIGTIIIMKGIQRAYDISEVKEKVRHHLRSTTPGVVLVVLASFLLAFCTYRASHIETVYSSRMLDYNNYKLATNGFDKPPIEMIIPSVDTLALTKLKNKAKKIAVDVPDIPKKVASKFDKKSKEKPVVANKKQSKKEALKQGDKKKEQTVIVKKQERRDMRKADRQNKSKLTVAANAPKKNAKKSAKFVASKYDHLKESFEEEKSIETKRGNNAAKTESANYNGIITQKDIAWAEQFQRNVTIYGYVPIPSEEERFNRIRRNMEKQGGYLNTELYWAYSFLQKTKRGYEPKPGEMRRYEDIINRTVRSSSAASSKHPEL